MDSFDSLLGQLRKITEQGWIPTLRSGDTGIGFTGETLLNIKANSSTLPDYEGIELKFCRRRSLQKNVTLFSRVPEFIGMTRTEVLQQYGYDDENGRRNLYISIYKNRNNQGWYLSSNQNEKKLFVCRENRQVGYWDFNLIRTRFETKHKETLFVLADTRGRAKQEEFHFNEIIHCKNSSFDKLLEGIENNIVFHDFVMHLKPNGVVRDHGFLFRTKQIYIPKLFSESVYKLLT